MRKKTIYAKLEPLGARHERVGVMSDTGAVTSERSLLGESVCLRLAGVIDERFEAGPILRELTPQVILELSGIKRITSFGVRQWSDAMKSLPSSVKHLYLLSAPACFIDQLNMVLNFGGRAEVVTATALYFCEKCQEERSVAIDVLGDHALLGAGAAPPAPCPTCGTAMALEDDPQQAFRYVKLYGCQTLDPEVGAALAKDGLYAPRKVGPPPEETKLVHGDVTLLVLSGTIDQRFRPRRLASGVEGEVVLDTGGVVGVDATGAERFSQLLSSLAEAGSVTLVDVPAPLLREIAGGALPLGRAQLASVLLAFQCPVCGATLRASVTRAQGAAFRPPCARCGEPTLLSGAGPWLERAFSGAVPSPLPLAVDDLIERRSELLSRARVESGARPTGSDAALGRYRVLRPLSRGGMAEILLAVHEGIGGFEKLIALKKIRRKLLERRHVAVELFLNEAKIVANLNHPNIVQTFEVGEHGGDLFIAMEYVHGVDARTIIKRRTGTTPQLALEHILYIGTQVAAALDHAHKARDLSGRQLHIVHRDVSLSNIVVGFDGQVKLVDFGIATASSVVAKGGLIGKFSYMSPEQVQKEPLDGRSDVFSLGIVLYELIAGKPLFRRSTDEETLLAVQNDPVPSLAEFGVVAEVEAVLLQSLARRREDRYADARAFELGLQGALQRVGGMSAHQLSMRMRELFPEDSSAAPTANLAGGVERSPSSPSNGSGSGREDGFVARSNTFEPRLATEHETGETLDVPTPTAPRRALDPKQQLAIDSTKTPPLGVAARVEDAPTPTAVVVAQQVKRAGEGVHFNRSPTAGASHGSSPVRAPAPPPVQAPAPPPSQLGRIALIGTLLFTAAGLLVWLFLRG